MISERIIICARVLDFLYRNAGCWKQPEIARSLWVSRRYMEQSLQKMTRHGWLMSERGPTGGYAITFEGQSVTLFEIYRSFYPDDEVGAQLLSHWKTLKPADAVRAFSAAHRAKEAA